VYEETLTGRAHDPSAPVTMKMWMQFNVMPRNAIRFATSPVGLLDPVSIGKAVGISWLFN